MTRWWFYEYVVRGLLILWAVGMFGLLEAFSMHIL